jgi:aldehyde dehydrogenase (NAD+)
MTIQISELMTRLGVAASAFTGGTLDVHAPITGEKIASVKTDTRDTADAKIAAAHDAFKKWRTVPGPVRGELVRLLGEQLRAHKDDLGALVTIEAGKITSEGLGEVQEMIDICDFAVGLSRQLYGLTIQSERPGHHMREMWHPLGVVGIISAFNFPVAVWNWNSALALVCGDTCLWKPSEKTPLVALATQALFEKALAAFHITHPGTAPENLSQLLIGRADIGEQLVNDHRVPLISATGSTRMGAAVGPAVAKRFGRSLLELGGNNATIVAPTADLELAVRAICFGACGTAGQRCTTLRRLFVHESIYDTLVPRLKKAYDSLPIGDPRAPGTLVGPLIDTHAGEMYDAALAAACEQGGKVHGGGRADTGLGGTYVKPAIVEMAHQTAIVKTETFAPIMYVMKYTDLDDAIHMLCDVPQGLSSSIITLNMREAEVFTSATGSDCGIANVNMGTSGAEIGGAFGGEKETGGGRESGSDAWKTYMRRQTQSINYSSDVPLAQGVKFDVG